LPIALGIGVIVAALVAISLYWGSSSIGKSISTGIGSHVPVIGGILKAAGDAVARTIAWWIEPVCIAVSGTISALFHKPKDSWNTLLNWNENLFRNIIAHIHSLPGQIEANIWHGPVANLQANINIVYNTLVSWTHNLQANINIVYNTLVNWTHNLQANINIVYNTLVSWTHNLQANIDITFAQAKTWFNEGKSEAESWARGYADGRARTAEADINRAKSEAESWAQGQLKSATDAINTAVGAINAARIADISRAFEGINALSLSIDAVQTLIDTLERTCISDLCGGLGDLARDSEGLVLDLGDGAVILWLIWAAYHPEAGSSVFRSIAAPFVATGKTWLDDLAHTV
jgi:hypothetical protein